MCQNKEFAGANWQDAKFLYPETSIILTHAHGFYVINLKKMSYNSEDYFLSDEFKDVMKRFEDAGKNDQYASLDSEELIDIAEYYYNHGDIARAKDIVEKALSIYPGSSAPLLFKARMALLNKDNVTKAEYYTEQIEDKSDIEYFYMKAEILLYEGKNEEADKYLEEQYDIIDEDEKDDYPIDVAALLIDYNDIEHAEKWLKRSEDVDSPEYKEQMARLMMGKGEYEKSKKLFNELIDENPYSTHYWNELASTQFYSRNIEDSIRSSEYSIAINPKNSAALLNKANGLYNLGNYEGALEYYKKYIKLCPDDDNGEMLIGFCCLLLDKYEEAIIHLKKAEQLSPPQSPNLIDIYKDMAFALCRLGRIKESMAVMDKTEKLCCNHNEMLIYRGNLLIGSGCLLESKKYFIQAIKSSGCSPYIFMRIAITVYECGEPMISYKMFKILFRHYKDWHNGYAFFAACCYELGKIDEFILNLNNAALHTPKELKFLLGKLFPKDMDPKDYYQYILDKLKNKMRDSNQHPS